MPSPSCQVSHCYQTFHSVRTSIMPMRWPRQSLGPALKGMKGLVRESPTWGSVTTSFVLFRPCLCPPALEPAHHVITHCIPSFSPPKAASLCLLSSPTAQVCHRERNRLKVSQWHSSLLTNLDACEWMCAHLQSCCFLHWYRCAPALPGARCTHLSMHHKLLIEADFTAKSISHTDKLRQ